MSAEPIHSTELAAVVNYGLIWEGDRAPLAKAFIIGQTAMEAVKKAATNPAFRTKYADLSEVVEAVVPALNKAGIGVIQTPGYDGEWVSVSTTFLHESGSSVTSVLKLRPSKTDPQGVGSAVTYGRRYSLLAMTGAAPEDDDGNASSGPRQQHQQQQREPDTSAAADFAIGKMRTSRDLSDLTEFWTKNAKGLRAELTPADFARVEKAKDEEKVRLTPAPDEAETPFDKAA